MIIIIVSPCIRSNDRYPNDILPSGQFHVGSHLPVLCPYAHPKLHPITSSVRLCSFNSDAEVAGLSFASAIKIIS